MRTVVSDTNILPRNDAASPLFPSAKATAVSAAPHATIKNVSNAISNAIKAGQRISCTSWNHTSPAVPNENTLLAPDIALMDWMIFMCLPYTEGSHTSVLAVEGSSDETCRRSFSSVPMETARYLCANSGWWYGRGTYNPSSERTQSIGASYSVGDFLSAGRLFVSPIVSLRARRRRGSTRPPAMASGASLSGLPAPVELFVCGRLCLLGEHSDWAGAYRHPEAVIPAGMCLVVGTSKNQGIHALVSLDPSSPMTFTMVSTDDQGVSRTKRFPLDDRVSLQTEAKAGGFWSHVAGTLFALLFSVIDGDGDGDDADRNKKTLVSERVKHAMATHNNPGIVLTNHKTTLPIAKGLSSSAAVCVLVARAFSKVFSLELSNETEAALAYAGERETPSKCGRMDQAGCAFGSGKLTLLSFTGDDVVVTPVVEVGAELFFVVADLRSSKDTVGILADLQRAFRKELELPVDERNSNNSLAHLLGDMNHEIIGNAVKAIGSGDVAALGEVFETAQLYFDAIGTYVFYQIPRLFYRSW